MAKADLHCHSKYSNRPSEWFLKKMGTSESYTEPETIYQMAKERSMNFVTITDHNEIEGSLKLAEKYSDAFTGVETTTYFPEDNCKIHLLIYGLTPSQFEEIQNIRRNIYTLREYVVDQGLTYSVAHGLSSVDGKLSINHLEKLSLLFDVFETINGARGRAGNNVWYQYLKHLNRDKFHELQQKHGIIPISDDSWAKSFTGGSDDHAGLHIGKTYTLANATAADDFLTQIRTGKSFAEGRSGDFTGLVFTVYKVALEFSKNKSRQINTALPLYNLLDFIFSERKPSLMDRFSLAMLKTDSSNSVKRHLAELIEEIRKQEASSIDKNLDLFYAKVSEISDEVIAKHIDALRKNLTNGNFDKIVADISSILPALFLLVPFFSSLKNSNDDRPLISKVEKSIPIKSDKKILWFSDTFSELNGVTVTLKKLGWKFWANDINVRFAVALLEDELSDELPPNVMNLKTCYHFEIPYYNQYKFKVPSILKALREINEYEPDEIFVSTPGPIGMLGVITAKLFSIPLTGIYHTDFSMELDELVEEDNIVEAMEGYSRWYYSIMDEIKVPTESYMDILEERGLDRSKMSIFPRHLDNDIFAYHPPEKWNGSNLHLPDGLNLIYVGRVSKDKNLEFLINVYREVRKQCDDINLIVAGSGPYLEEMKAALNDKRVVFTGRLPNETMPMIYSQAHTLVFPSITDTYGMAVLEAQCCELPAIVSDQGGPKEIIEDGKTGSVLPALKLDSWVNAILDMNDLVMNRPEEYKQIRTIARQRAVKMSGWEAVLKQLTREELVPGSNGITK